MCLYWFEETCYYTKLLLYIHIHKKWYKDLHVFLELTKNILYKNFVIYFMFIGKFKNFYIYRVTLHAPSETDITRILFYSLF